MASKMAAKLENPNLFAINEILEMLIKSIQVFVRYLIQKG